jgi:hypothetical protein
VAIIYVMLSFVVLMAFVGLAVDLARAEAAKTELQRDADAAARAGASALLTVGWDKPGGADAAMTAAINVMTFVNSTKEPNYVDGSSMKDVSAGNQYFDATVGNYNSRDLQVGNWNFTRHAFTVGGSPTNAVRVWARRTTADGDPIPMLFTSLLGRKTVDVWAVSIAAVANLTDGAPADGSSSTDAVAQQTVGGNYNPYLAGAPAWSPTANQNEAYPTGVKGTYASAPEEATSNYDTTQSTPSDPNPDLYQDTNTTLDTEHPLEYDVADPNAVGGNVPGTESKDDPKGDPSESPLQLTTTDGGELPYQAGDTVQINVPTPYDGDSNNLVTNDNGEKPITDANGQQPSQGNDYSQVYEDVGATPNNSPEFNQYAAYSNDPQANYTGDPTQATTTNLSTDSSDDDVVHGTENNLTNVAAPLNSVLAVFLPPATTGNTDTTSPPPSQGNNTPGGYDFSSQTARDYTSISPQTQQVFYAGSGQTSTGYTQNIVVPNLPPPPNGSAYKYNVPRLYLGVMDGQEWANNAGKFSGITINILRVELVQ